MQLLDERAIFVIKTTKLGDDEIVEFGRYCEQGSLPVHNRPPHSACLPVPGQRRRRVVDTVDVEAMCPMEIGTMPEQSIHFFRGFHADIQRLPLLEVHRIGVDFTRAPQQRRRIRPTRKNGLTADDDDRVGLEVRAKRTDRTLKIG